MKRVGECPTVAVSDTIVPLSNPRHKRMVCELCKEPATIRCSECKLTFYCCRRHQVLDWEAIHNRLCPLMAPLRDPDITPLPFRGTLEDKAIKYKLRRDLLDNLMEVTMTTAQRLMYEGRPLESIPAALQTLRFARELYGASNIRVVPSFLILADASIALGRLNQAKDYLTQAEWSVVQAEDPPRSILYRLHRVMGFHAASNCKYEEARQHFADDIYYASEEYGVESLKAAGGYFYLARTFLEMGKITTAYPIFSHVTELWRKHLTYMIEDLRGHKEVKRFDASKVNDHDDQPAHTLDEAETMDGQQCLRFIHSTLEAVEAQGLVVCKALHSLAMLFYLDSSQTMALEYGEKALRAMEELEERGGFLNDVIMFYDVYKFVRNQRTSEVEQEEEQDDTEAGSKSLDQDD